MIQNSAQIARKGLLARYIVQIAVIVGLGTVIGSADAIIRPVKLARTVEEFSLPTEGARPEVTSGTVASDRTRAGADEPKPEAMTDADSAGSSASKSSAEGPVAAAGQSGGGTGGFQFTPKDRLKPGHITIEEARRAFDSGQASFVDARSKSRYEEGHIPGAIRLELADFVAGQPAKLALLPREFMVIVYCGGGDCDESERVAERLEGSGYQRIFIIHDGFPGWKAAGHEVETGPEEFE
ncbi:MAG: rhodanese-like domain-containing protein [Phycisphaeraceae bacterium]|nr:rhodanese-like domain-containing protein [Phycisphaeraceae bacterium]